jgi:hypothetical protein
VKARVGSDDRAWWESDRIIHFIMQINRTMVEVGLLAGFIGFMAIANLLAYPMLEEVNATREPSEQFPVSTFRLHFFEIWKEHARQFPQSRQRLWCVVCILAAAACFFVLICTALL